MLTCEEGNTCGTQLPDLAQLIISQIRPVQNKSFNFIHCPVLFSCFGKFYQNIVTKIRYTQLGGFTENITLWYASCVDYSRVSSFSKCMLILMVLLVREHLFSIESTEVNLFDLNGYSCKFLMAAHSRPKPDLSVDGGCTIDGQESFINLTVGRSSHRRGCLHGTR